MVTLSEDLKFLRVERPDEWTMDRLIKKAEELEKALEIYMHYHVNNGSDDFCKKCGLDLMHPIHFRSTD